jgi:hypothetical protein
VILERDPQLVRLACAVYGGVPCFCPAVGMVLQTLPPSTSTHGATNASKRVLVINKNGFERACKVLNLDPTQKPTKQDSAWPAPKDIRYEEKAQARRSSIEASLAREDIEFSVIYLYPGDRYGTPLSAQLSAEPHATRVP